MDERMYGSISVHGPIMFVKGEEESGEESKEKGAEWKRMEERS